MKDVVPALKTNSEGLRKVLEDLVKQFNTKQLEMDKWKACRLVPDRRANFADGRCQIEEEQCSGGTTIMVCVMGIGIWAG